MDFYYGLARVHLINIDGAEYIKLEDAKRLAIDVMSKYACDTITKAINEGFEQADTCRGGVK